MSKRSRKRKIILMSLAFMKNHGEKFVEMIPHYPEENKRAWRTLRGEIEDLYSELKQKFDSKTND